MRWGVSCQGGKLGRACANHGLLSVGANRGRPRCVGSTCWSVPARSRSSPAVSTKRPRAPSRTDVVQQYAARAPRPYRASPEFGMSELEGSPSPDRGQGQRLAAVERPLKSSDPRILRAGGLTGACHPLIAPRLQGGRAARPAIRPTVKKQRGIQL